MRDQNGIKNKNYKHGMCEDRFYFIFRNANVRCSNKKDKKYPIYGGRGIIVEWVNFIAFKDDMLKSYQDHISIYGIKNTQLDRINSDGNYSKDNCRWATLKEQSKNRRNINLYDYMGEKLTLFEISKKKGLSKNAIYQRIKNGWDIKSAINS